MASHDRLGGVLVWLCAACGARTDLDRVELTVGGKPNVDVPSAGAPAAGGPPVGAAGTGPSRPPDQPLRVESIAVGGRRSCAVLTGGLKCWGANPFGSLGLEDPEARGDEPGEMGNQLPFIKLGSTVQVARVVPGNAEHTCALLANGQVKCWGDNDFGQLGLETFIDRGGYPGEMGDALPFVQLGPGADVVQLSAGSNHTCALLRDGSLRCWGNNGNGQLGLAGVLNKGGSTGDMGANLPPVPLGGARAVQIAAASVHTCALLQGGTLKCWGWERGFEDEPVTPESSLTTVDLEGQQALALVAGGGHSCVLLSDNLVRCWAVTEHARIPPLLSLPVQLGAVPVVELSVGGGRGCALLADSTVHCWTISNDGAPAGPSQVQLGAGAVQMSASGGRMRHHGCALLVDGSVKCWGENKDGQLGLGDVSSRDGAQTGALQPVDLGTLQP